MPGIDWNPLDPMEPVYQPVTPAIAALLRDIVGEQYVIYDEPDRMLDYAHDEVAGAEYL